MSHRNKEDKCKQKIDSCKEYYRIKTDVADTKYLDSRSLVSETIKSETVETKKVKVNNISAENVIYQGINIQDAQKGAPRSIDYVFDVLQDTGILNNRTPVKPPTVNQDVFDAMLLSIRDNVLPEVCERFNKGRERLGLPKVPTDPDIIGTISLPIITRAFPDSLDPEERELFRFNLSLGWNIEVANTALPLGVENKPSCLFQASITGNIMTVTDVEFGLIQSGTYLSGVGIPDNTIIIEQLSVDEIDDPFFKQGTYKLGKVVDNICDPSLINLNLPVTEITGTQPQGPRILGIYLQYGYIDAESGQLKVIPYDLGNLQIKPTIDFDPFSDPLTTPSWGEKYQGYRSVTTNIAVTIFENMPDLDDTGCLQLVVLRETGVVVISPSDDKGYRTFAARIAARDGGNTIASRTAARVAARIVG